MTTDQLTAAPVFQRMPADPATPGRTAAPTELALAQHRDRQRIARDLHDHVLQRLFAAGLTAQRVARGLAGNPAADLELVVAEIDETMRQIRATVFELRGPLGPERGTVTARLQSVVTGLHSLLGFAPSLRCTGTVDTLSEGMVDDLAAVLREGLANTARHAHALCADIDVIATTDAVWVRLYDDGIGIGIGIGTRRSGLDNLRVRAEQRGGSLRVVSPGANRAAKVRAGTCLLWSAPRG